jgi:palmitoyltransferase ZDHHC9/14/18
VEVKRSTKLSSKSTSALAKIRSTKAKIEAKRPKPQATPASKSNPSLSSKTSGSSLRQTTIPFKRVSDAASKAAVESSSESEDESEDDGAVREFAKLPSRALKRPSTATSVRSAAATVKKNVVRSVRGPRRAAAVAKMGLGLGVNRMGGLGEGGSGSTIRVITRSDE